VVRVELLSRFPPPRVALWARVTTPKTRGDNKGKKGLQGFNNLNSSFFDDFLIDTKNGLT